MSNIFSASIQTTTQWLVEYFGKDEYKNASVEAWVFADKQQRLAAESALLKLGVQSKIQSTYKPLLHFFLEDMPLSCKEFVRAEVHYPIHKSAVRNRFLLETYPLAGIFDEHLIDFIADTNSQNTYTVIFHLVTGETVTKKVFAPNHLHQDLINESRLSPTGWLRITDPSGNIIKNERLFTDYERLFHDGILAISAYQWPKVEPHFEELNIQVFLPWKDEKLSYQQEVISLKEALHEDFYFSILEWFNVKSGYKLNSRQGQPGQIIPEIIYSDNERISIKIETRPYQLNTSTGRQILAKASYPISMEQISEELNRVSGSSFFTTTITGRTVQARYHKGEDSPVMISGGQHANETTGVVGALRAAQVLDQQPNSHFTISPLENPDGYALHQRLIADNPYHMHHSARYTALGDDLESRDSHSLYEKEIRLIARSLSRAKLHINLHGYPSHEWTRPLSGYVPKGFDMWTLPKGFFIILRHRPQKEWREYAEAFLTLVTNELSKIKGLMEFNAKQISLYQKYTGENNFRFINGFPCLISTSKSEDVPIQLITEYPDETLYDEHFIEGHTVQKHTVLAAYHAHQKLSNSIS
ncbi:peptidase M14 [Marinomonas sp. C2222]|uniref:Peptidase M14 n=1 Tax=Marinomonas sargassi TaxID=2984494 RepID=A0ABT2YQ89_9GAMM|nr:peptidase M14 [Marinomonas sargassi]MCV2402048.1 peptidase M14 [Marinomonas sargassi]